MGKKSTSLTSNKNVVATFCLFPGNHSPTLPYIWTVHGWYIGWYMQYVYIFGTLLRVPTFSSWLTNSCVFCGVSMQDVCVRHMLVVPKKMCVMYKCMSIVCVYWRKMAENPLGPGGFIFRKSTIDLRGFLRDLVWFILRWVFQNM